MKTYHKPQLTSLGSLQSMTQQGQNKIGPNGDVHSASVPIVGSIVDVKP